VEECSGRGEAREGEVKKVLRGCEGKNSVGVGSRSLRRVGNRRKGKDKKERGRDENGLWGGGDYELERGL